MKYAVLLGLLFSLSASAEVSGRWAGWGEWLFDGQGTDCPTMVMNYQETATQLKRLGGTFDCGIVVLHSDPLTWEKKGTELFLNGAKAGEITANGFTAAEPYNDEGTMVYTKFTREGGHADYQERWIGKDGAEIYVINGRLFYGQPK